ncbi:MAG: hypothetical protein HN377_04530, partial [Alphaproteobacteria bacterium]|nr:hypothetical protein [Alphaproteobacteria bacterium]
MPAIGHPGFEHDYVIDSELRHIRDHHLERGVPSRTPENLLIASWNLCNLGDTAQQRSAADLMLMAEVLKPFDLIAVQEIKDDFRQFREMVHLMGPDFDYLITDRAGNDERLGFVYNIRRVTRLQLAGELVILKHERKPVEMTVNGTTKKVAFPGFNRNPYMCAFKARQFTFTLVNVHIYYGATSGARFRRR